MRSLLIEGKAVTCRRFVTSALLLAFASALILSVAPQLHERLHKNAAQAGHECAVTLVATGGYQQTDAAPVFAAPELAAHFSRLPTSNPVWVATLFLGASIFEHAPPALS
ncbi:MAG: hypothetical protein QOF94_2261 [Acidobacteriaceae bacterium]